MNNLIYFKKIALGLALFAVITRFMTPGWGLLTGGFIFLPALAFFHRQVTCYFVDNKIMSFRKLLIMQSLFALGALLRSMSGIETTA